MHRKQGGGGVSGHPLLIRGWYYDHLVLTSNLTAQATASVITYWLISYAEAFTNQFEWHIILAVLAASVLLVFFLAGCASQPDTLATQHISPDHYQNLDCVQISMEMERTSQRISELYKSLKKTADDDAAQMGVGLILLWPTLFFLEGGDGPQAAEYSRLKGEYEALESAAIRKNCTISTAAKIARWSAQAEAVATDSCTSPGAAKLIGATGEQEDYQFACENEAAVLVRCTAGDCRTLQ